MKFPIADNLIINEENLAVIVQFAEKIPGGFFIYKAFGDQELIYFNSHLVSIYGCESEEEFRQLTGNSFKGLVHPEDYAASESSILDQIKESKEDVDHVKYRFIRKDGSVGMMDDYGHFSHSESFGDIYYVFVQDITKEYLEEQRIAQMELLNQVSGEYDGVFVIDCANDTRRTSHDRLSGAANYDDAVSYSELFSKYVENFVCEPDYEMMKGFADPANMLKIIGDSQEMSVTYRDRTTGTPRFYEMKLIRYSDTEVLQSFRENDAEMVNSLLFEKLKDNYFAIFGVDLETGLMRSYKEDPLNAFGKEGEISTLKTTMMNLASHFEGDARDFFERNSDVQRIKERFATEDRAEYFYKSPLEEGKWTDATGIVFERNEEGVPTLFCIAFNYLDEESSRLQDMQEQLRTALEEARKANATVAEQQLLAGKAEQERKDQIAKISGTESTYIVDPATGRFQILNQNEYLAENYRAEENFDESFTRYIETDVFEQDREMVSKAITVPAMVAHLEKEPEYIVRYRDISKGTPRWFEMKAVRLSEKEILYGFSDKDDEIIVQLMFEKFREHYFGLYYINIDSGFAQIIKTGHPEITGNAGEFVPYSELMRKIASASDGEAKEFFCKISNIDYIRNRFADEDFAYHIYKSHLFEGNRWVNYTGRVLQRHEDGSPALFSLDFSMLDEEATAKEEANLRLSEALDEAESANRAKTSFVNSFKALYQVMYYIDLRTCRTDFLYGDEEAEKFLPIFNADTPEKIFENFKKYYVDALIEPEDRDRVKEMMSVSNMYSSLKTGNSISVNYRVRRNLVDSVYTEMSIIKAEEEEGELTAIIMAFRMTDEELREALETRKRLEADARIIGALSEDFSCVDYVEISDSREDEISVGVRSSGLLRRVIPEWDIIPYFSEKMKLFCEKLVYGPDRELFRQEVDRDTVLEKLGRTDSYYFNIRLLLYGEIKYYQVKSSAVRENERLVGVVIGIRSVDEYTRKDIEIKGQLKEALAEAESASRAKTDFLFNMSHDIRTPMNAILGFTGMAQKHLQSTEKVSDYLGKIDSSGKQLLELINQVLEMSRLESGKMEIKETPVNIIEQYNTAVTMLSEQARDKGIEFHHSLTDALHLNVFADTAKMSSITLNIVGNAIKYTPEGGRIDYSLRAISPRKPGCATYEFTVADTGIGMSREFLETLYEPFTREQNTTMSEIQGTGLGLSIVKNLVDLLGGSIEVQSEPGRGTRFDIIADFRINDTANRRAEEELRANEILFNGKRVLLVEDNEMNRDIATDILEDEGLEVESAVNGAEAVDMLREKGADCYDFILMDIQMPVMNGLEAARAIRAMFPDRHIPIIAVSANAFEEDKMASLAAGMDDHVAKPIDIGELFRSLARHM